MAKETLLFLDIANERYVYISRTPLKMVSNEQIN